MDVLKRMEASGIVPVVVLEKAEDAVPTAKALAAGGIDVMEITFRTSAAPDSIQAVAEQCPDVLVGAGTVVTLAQCKLAVKCGARFIVAPGYDEEVVSWCVDNGIPVTPGCVTPTEIMMALKHDLKVLKFFPANVYGGLSAIKSLAGPFGGVKFIPTGGVNQQNIGEFAASPLIHAVGGSWVCTKGDISAHRFDKITALSKEARKGYLGFELVHVGINCQDAEQSLAVSEQFEKAFGFSVERGESSNFASSGVEVLNRMYLGKNGHVAIRTNKIETAIAELERQGFALDMASAKMQGDRIHAVYLKEEIGGFAVHLLQK